MTRRFEFSMLLMKRDRRRVQQVQQLKMLKTSRTLFPWIILRIAIFWRVLMLLRFATSPPNLQVEAQPRHETSTGLFGHARDSDNSRRLPEAAANSKSNCADSNQQARD